MTTARRVSRRLLAFVSLMLVIGSITGTPPTHAAPIKDASVGIWLYAQQVKGSHTICVGDKVSIRVRVSTRIGVEGTYNLTTLLGEEINAFVDGSGVGTIAPPKSTTSLDSRPAGASYFTFSADKAGSTTVVFQAKVNQRSFMGVPFSGDTVTAAVPLTVENCQYRVTTFSRWHLQGEADLKVMARIDGAGMAEDGGGHYKGTAAVEWIVTPGQVGTCSATVTGPNSQAELSGQVYGYDEFTITLTFLPANLTINIDCGDGAVGSVPMKVLPDPLSVSVLPIGGSDRQLQGLLWVETTLGPNIVIVKRMTGN